MKKIKKRTITLTRDRYVELIKSEVILAAIIDSGVMGDSEFGDIEHTVVNWASNVRTDRTRAKVVHDVADSVLSVAFGKTPAEIEAQVAAEWARQDAAALTKDEDESDRIIRGIHEVATKVRKNVKK